jgi:uncharacterized protein (UPF0371 family)
MRGDTGFDTEHYLQEQTAAILKRLERFDNKMYVAFGGKLLSDSHAARVLPGFHPEGKLQLLQRLGERAEVLLCVHAGGIARAGVSGGYDAEPVRLVEGLRQKSIALTAVVLTRFDDQASATALKEELEGRGIPVYTHRFTKGYPADTDVIVSDEGYGANDYIETERPLVIVAGPARGSGKLTTCLSQMYHDYRRGVRSGLARLEMFPVWDLGLNHPVNVAFAATAADLGEPNITDSFHMDAHGTTAVGSGPDLQAFPLLKSILEHITGGDPLYRSPTEMGVNAMSLGITDSAVVRKAACAEVIRRYFDHASEHALGLLDKVTVERTTRLMKALDLAPRDRTVVKPAREAATECEQKGKGNEGVFCGAAIQLRDDTIVTGKNSPTMHAASSLVLNAVKQLAGVPDEIHLLAPAIIRSIGRLKVDALDGTAISLDLEETLIALGISAATSHVAQLCVERLAELRGCEVHLTHRPTPGDAAGLRRLGVHLTSDAGSAAKGLSAG